MKFFSWMQGDDYDRYFRLYLNILDRAKSEPLNEVIPDMDNLCRMFYDDEVVVDNIDLQRHQDIYLLLKDTLEMMKRYVLKNKSWPWNNKVEYEE